MTEKKEYSDKIQQIYKEWKFSEQLDISKHIANWFKHVRFLNDEQLCFYIEALMKESSINVARVEEYLQGNYHDWDKIVSRDILNKISKVKERNMKKIFDL